jgi:hypothetical protein
LKGPRASVRGFGPPQSYIAKDLAERIPTSKSALEGERKRVTVLFADLRRLDGRLHCLSTSEDDLSGSVSTIARREIAAFGGVGPSATLIIVIMRNDGVLAGTGRQNPTGDGV